MTDHRDPQGRPPGDPHAAFDAVGVRCPRLGGEVTFGYCRRLHRPLPCPRALVCFERRFPVGAYFRRVLSEAAFVKAFTPRSDHRVERLLRAVERAKKTEP